MAVNYLPDFLLNDRVVKSLYESIINEGALLNASITDIIDQCFVSRATWGLRVWEEFLGIKVNETLSNSSRRQRILSKIRGYGTVTKELIARVAESFVNGEVIVEELPSPGVIKVQFVSDLGVPERMSDIQDALRAIIPAHLVIEYGFDYLLISEVHGVMTLEELEQTELKVFAPFII